MVTKSTKNELLIDGSYFTFPSDWDTFVFDEWDKFQAVSGAGVKGCDVIGVDAEGTLWLVEMKDYTYRKAQQPEDLPKVVAAKAVGTMGVLFSVARAEAEHSKARTVQKCADAKRVHVAMHVQIKDAEKKRKSVPKALADLKANISKYTKPLGVAKVFVSGQHGTGSDVPWSARRDPESRSEHFS